ncbi:MAG: nucleotide pyrophosphatase, partial [Deltaproteobacteria bacterium]|nr:nucleotide pyrophosphatase [Deltaproteobacteria bacterium]
TANSYFDPDSKKEYYMDRAELLLVPTVFEKAKRGGMKSALLTAKVKTVTLLRRGADLAVAAERPDREWVNKLGAPADIYSSEINDWIWKAVMVLLRERPDIDLFYCHTTDYTMHMSDPSGEASQSHLHRTDRLLGEILNQCPDMELYLTADHGMGYKSLCYDLNRYMPERGLPIYFAMSAERDPYIKHHRTFGGTAYVWLNRPADEAKAMEILHRTEGVEAVYGRREAASLFHLHPDRIGDVMVTGDRGTVFGPLNVSRETLPKSFRAHGSRYEAPVPLLIYNAKVDPSEADAYVSNCHLTSRIRL